MFQTALRYLFMFAILLTSNSQAFMAAQSLLAEAERNVELVIDDFPPCHQMTDKIDVQSQIQLSEIQLECERDCHCCGGSCSSFAMVFDLPQALSGQQRFEAQFFLHFSPKRRQEALQRPPIFA